MATTPDAPCWFLQNEKPPEALQWRETQQPRKQCYKYLLPNFQATALWGLLNILLVTCLFSTLPAHLERKRAHYCTKMSRACQKGHFHQGSLSYLPLVQGGTLILLFQITAHLIPMFKNLRYLVSKAEPGKSALKSRDSDRKHENSCNCKEVLTTWFAIVTSLCRILRSGWRSSEVMVNSLGMSKCWPHKLLHKLLLFSMLNEETNLVSLGRKKKGSSFPCAIQDPVPGRKEKANTCLLTLRSTQFPLGSVFQEAWKLLHQILPAFNAGSTHLTKVQEDRT